MCRFSPMASRLLDDEDAEPVDITVPKVKEEDVRTNVAAEVVYDSSLSFSHQTYFASASERRNFMSPNVRDMCQKPTSQNSISQPLDTENDKVDIAKLLKDIEYMGSSQMSWKERKKLENEKVVTLGGKPVKKHRTPLSVAKPAMKNQKKREQKKMEENILLGRFMKRGNNSKEQRKLKPEERVLKSAGGHFSKGVLNVKHLLKPAPFKSNHGEYKMSSRGKKKGKGKKGKRKGR